MAGWLSGMDLAVRAPADRQARAVRAIWVATGMAVLARFAGLLWPPTADEAGFAIVAAHWEPMPDSVFGQYFVDRPPLLIAIVSLANHLCGPLALRVIAALGCALLVLLAAGAAKQVVLMTSAHELGRARADQVAKWVAIATAAVVSNPAIDIIAAKGEVLALPVLVGSCWATLRALETGSPRLACGAGLLAAIALGLKQNQVGGLVFAAVALATAWWCGRAPLRRVLTLAAAGLAGAAVPVLATVAWAVLSRVRLEVLWYTVFGFRSDAALAIAGQPAGAVHQRAVILAVVFVGTGMVLIAGWFLLRFSLIARRSPIVAYAALAMLVVDLTGLVLGGSYWRPYLFGLLPSLVFALALIVSAGSLPRETARRHRLRVLTVVGVAVASASVGQVSSAGGFAVITPAASQTGTTIARAAAPGDTIVVFGGRSDVVWASGLDAPYPYLWSLPMRVLDRDLIAFRRLVAGPDPPTWLVEWVRFDAWQTPGNGALRRLVHERYVRYGGCGEAVVYVLRGIARPRYDPGCD